MLRTPKTLAMLAAAVGLPYTASETQFGRDAMQMLGRGTSSLSAPVEDFLSSTRGPTFGDNAHRDVEGIWEQTIDRYRYNDLAPGVVASSVAPPSNELAGRFSTVAARSATGDSATPAPNQMPTLMPTNLAIPSGTSLVGRPIADLREVLRFDITPQWVTERFSRVTTVLADLNLDGVRVPLVTGTGVNDLAGSISYYFDQTPHLQRVMLHGFTGDPQAVIATMTAHYGLIAEPTLEAGVYTKRWNGVPVHFLRITHAPIVYSDALHHKYTVFLELNQPDLRYGISPEAERIIVSDRSTNRW